MHKAESIPKGTLPNPAPIFCDMVAGRSIALERDFSSLEDYVWRRSDSLLHSSIDSGSSGKLPISQTGNKCNVDDMLGKGRGGGV
jgi:hypothetical protein